jgi:hypothetical protein
MYAPTSYSEDELRSLPASRMSSLFGYGKKNRVK